MKSLKQLPVLLRASHWVKNTFVFAPLFFSGQLFNLSKLVPALYIFVAMCLAASAVYILNDLFDADRDRLHPVKKYRPIAGKTVSESTAKVMAAFLAGFALSMGFFTSIFAGLLLLIYLIINWLYSYKLKHIPVLDVTLIALGFLIRILAGGIATNIEVSHWLAIMTFVLALFLAIGKRHDDLLLLEKTGSQMRKSLDGYNLKFTSQAMTLLAVALFLLYYQYLEIAPTAVQFRGKMPYISSIFVLLGMLRYLQATFVHEKSGSPVAQLLTDRFLQTIILGWLGHFIFMLYY